MRREDWRTPRAFFDALDRVFNFSMDAASSDENALCYEHYTVNDSGLDAIWHDNVWCNPPYGRAIGDWIDKAIESQRHSMTCLLVPASTETAWFQRAAEHATCILFVRGRLRFDDGKGSPTFPSACLFIGPMCRQEINMLRGLNLGIVLEA